MDQAEWKLLKEIAELEKTPQGAYNIRRNGALDSRNSTANIEITTKTEPGKSGIDIRIKPGTRHESVHIPPAGVLAEPSSPLLPQAASPTDIAPARSSASSLFFIV